MNEIEKMYENAGIKPTHYDACVLEDKYWNNEELANQYGTFDSYLSFECPHYDDGCYSTCDYAYDKDYYPPFTAEKQLEITKFLLKKAVYYDVKDDKYWFYYEECESAGYKPFDEAIAHFINKLWQDLTEEEKMSIKNILEI
jgi:hypothetical protein